MPFSHKNLRNNSSFFLVYFATTNKPKLIVHKNCSLKSNYITTFKMKTRITSEKHSLSNLANSHELTLENVNTIVVKNRSMNYCVTKSQVYVGELHMIYKFILENSPKIN